MKKSEKTNTMKRYRKEVGARWNTGSRGPRLLEKYLSPEEMKERIASSSGSIKLIMYNLRTTYGGRIEPFRFRKSQALSSGSRFSRRLMIRRQQREK